MPQHPVAGVAIGREIVRRMRAARMTHLQLTETAGVSKTYVFQLLAGRSQRPDNRHLQAIAKVLGCNLDDILKGAQVTTAPQVVGNGEFVHAAEELILLRLFRSLSWPDRLQVIDELHLQAARARRRASVRPRAANGDDV